MEIRPVRADDEAAWRRLWAGYCEFYEEDMPERVTAATWKRLLDPASAMGCVVAEEGGDLVGFSDYIVHPSTWSESGYCYLEDLFVDPGARPRGAGRALIEAVRSRARELDCERVYWHTREDNARARALYDSFGPADGFVRYVV